ncbi:MAG: vWA domain-containing protein [Actinomycetota bacterium]
MSFEWPALLLLLVAIPALGVAYALLERRRERAAGAFAAPHMRPNLVRSRPAWRRHVPIALMLVALAALVMGTARPQREQVVMRVGGTIVFVIDASRSMNRTDIAPSRFEAARSASEVLVDGLPEDFRVGVVAFNREAQILSAPTLDREAISFALDSLETRYKTVLGDGIMAGLASVPEGGRSVQLVVLSDGVDTGSEVPPLAAADEAVAMDVRVNTVVLGSSTDLKAPDVGVLRQIADVTEGRFFAAPSAEELDSIYRSIAERASRSTEKVELTQAFVGGGLALMIASAALSALWFRKAL